MDLLNFGGLFYIEGREYVFLYKDLATEILCAAIILDPEITKEVKRARNAADRRNRGQEQPALLYVELCTKGYEDHSANLVTARGVAGKIESIKLTNKKLGEEDLKNIKKEILENRDLFRPSLVEFLESLSL